MEAMILNFMVNCNSIFKKSILNFADHKICAC